MRKIAIINHDLEPSEERLVGLFDNLGIEAKLFDIRETDSRSILDFKKNQDLLLLNRVYASVANRDYASLDIALKVLKDVELRGVKTVNSHRSTQADYSKYHAYKMMLTNRIRTPRTELYSPRTNIGELVDTLGSPVIVKRDSGGRGVDLAKCETKKEVENAIERISNSEDYNGGIIIQEFVQPVENRDYRVCVFDGKVLYHHGRSLISLDETESPWIASVSLGSEILPIQGQAPRDLEEFSKKAAASIGAALDVLDIIKTKDGWSVIEHNPTPSFIANYESTLGYCPVKYIAESLARNQI